MQNNDAQKFDSLFESNFGYFGFCFREIIQMKDLIQIE